jgi:ankyrin repeat protein
MISTQEVINELHFARNAHKQVLLPFGIFPFDDEQDITRLSANPIHLAASKGQEELARILINISDLNKKNQDITALSLALYRGHLRLAQMLLRNGARPDCSPKINSLHAAARQGYKEEMEHFVKGFNVDPDI